MIRTIYTKIFLWFWGATTAVTVCVLTITAISGGTPEGRRWLAHTLEFYAQSSVEFYKNGGVERVNAYLDDLKKNAGMDAALIGPDGRAVGGRMMPPWTGDLEVEARMSNESKFRAGLRWAGAAVVVRPEGTYILVARIYPLRGYWRGYDLKVGLLRLAMAILAAGILCFLLARHIAAPIRALQTAAGKIADGDLSVRATPSIAPREDELADLAGDFDRMAERIESLLQKQKEMLGDISHELRSPLARLRVSTELARRGDREALESIDADISRLDELIGQILLLTRMQSEDRKSKEPVNLMTVLEGVAKDARVEAAPEGKTVTLSATGNCNLTGYPMLLRSCFENIVRNAVKYTKPGTEVKIVAAEEAGPGGRMVRVEVADHGPGVPGESLTRIFEAFYRVSDSRERDSGGTGLGLAIAQKVALVHGGSIEACNRSTGGLAVIVRLPAQSVNAKVIYL